MPLLPLSVAKENPILEQEVQTESAFNVETGPKLTTGVPKSTFVTDVSDSDERYDSVGVGTDSNVSGTIKFDSNIYPDSKRYLATVMKSKRSTVVN